jgi:hypothetical protein
MIGIGPVEVLVFMLLWLVMAAVVLLVAYWVIRLAVRHGVVDAQRQMSGQGPFGRS